MAYLTDQELLERYEFYTLQIEERLLTGEDFETVSEQVPFMMTLNHPETFQLLDTNKKHTKLIGYSIEEIQEQWTEYIKTVHPGSVKSMLKFLPAFYNKEKPRQTMAFIQYSKLHRNSTYAPLITFTKPTRLPSGRVFWLGDTVKDFGKLSKQMEQIVRMDEFKLKHFRRFQQLTDREVEILKLLANGCNNPQIAERLFISRKTVETHRKHLKAKLELRSLRDLMRYAFAFDLVEC